MSIMLTTGSSFEGYKIERYVGIVNKEVFFHMGLGSSISAAIKDFANVLHAEDTELKGSSDLIQRAKEYLAGQFEEEIDRRGANAALGIDYETTILENKNIIRVAMNGTAVKIEKNISPVLTEEPDGSSHIPVSMTNIDAPFLPVSVEITVSETGIMAALEMTNAGESPNGIEADIAFVNLFGDVATVRDLVFLNFHPLPGKRCKSDPAPTTLPDHIYRCLRECRVTIKKYLTAAQVVEVHDRTLRAFANSPAAGVAQIDRLVDHLSGCDSAAEMLAYMDAEGLTADGGKIGRIYAAVRNRKEIERMYGKNLATTMNELRAIADE